MTKKYYVQKQRKAMIIKKLMLKYNKNSKLTCPIDFCKKDFKTIASLNSHIKTKHRLKHQVKLFKYQYINKTNE